MSASDLAVEAAAKALQEAMGENSARIVGISTRFASIAIAAAKEVLTRCPTCEPRLTKEGNCVRCGRTVPERWGWCPPCFGDEWKPPCESCNGTGTIPTSWDLESDEVVVKPRLELIGEGKWVTDGDGGDWPAVMDGAGFAADVGVGWLGRSIYAGPRYERTP